MAEVWFYHLEREPLESVLARILVKASARGDRVSVHLARSETRDALSQKLWAWEDISFLAHGCDGDAAPEWQPIWLTTGSDAPNNAAFRFYCEGRLPPSVDEGVRASILFDGGEETAVAAARRSWKEFKATGHAISYWRQNESGRWEDQAAGG